METTFTEKNDFLVEEKKTLNDTLLKIAVKIRDKIKEQGLAYLLTQGSDSLYGYIYLDEDCILYEREVKGFRVTANGELHICMDLSCVGYGYLSLVETFEDIDNDNWYLILKEDGNLSITDDFNVSLTLLSISDSINEYLYDRKYAA